MSRRRNPASDPQPRPIAERALQPKDLYTLEETAYRLSTSLWAVRTLCREGSLKFCAIGHSWLVSPEAIRQFIREREKAA